MLYTLFIKSVAGFENMHISIPLYHRHFYRLQQNIPPKYPNCGHIVRGNYSAILTSASLLSGVTS